MKFEQQLYDDGTRVMLFDCPGCGCLHSVAVQGGGTQDRPRWAWNGDRERPTIFPSVLVQWEQHGQKKVCHSFIEDGRIKFLGDCTHALVNQTVDLPNVET